ncbi:MAG: outer membrane protein insertion porin family [Verrucomicrobiota bacterium]|jgi:outer membrane protein insertion porin family|nr:outer membrane protein insertion porin family [Verrucomicrobiota bacterium]
MNFSRSSCRNWIFIAIISAALNSLGSAQQPPPGQPAQPPPGQNPQVPGTEGQPPQPAPRQQSPIVRQIEIQYAGPATLSRQRILSNMKTTVGQPYSEQTVEDDVRSLYATGLVTNVRIYGEPLPDGVKVIVVVQTRVTLSEIVIQGNQAIKAKRLRRELNIKTGSPLDEQALEQARQKLVELYQKRGYPDTDVQYKVDVNEDRGTARVTFAVSEGQKSVVKRIRFVGNGALTAKRLRKEMKTKENNILGFVTGAGRLNNQQLDGDVQKLKELYQDNGYADAQITDVKIDRLDKKNVVVTIYITEGQQYHVGTLSVEGLHIVTEANFRKVIKVTEGKIFSPQKLQKDIKSVEDAYGVAGYADAKVNVQTTPAGPSIVNLSYKVDEGIQSFVEHINISGNSRTKDKVLRREIILSPGDVFDTVRVDISKKRLEGLQYFERVDTYASDTAVPGRKDLNVVVQEKRTGNLNFGLGFSTTDGLLGFAELAQGNFDIMNWRTFTGAGQKFRARVQLGTQTKNASIELSEPYFLDQRLAFGGRLFFDEYNYFSDVYDQRDYGFDIFMRKPITNFLSVKLDYTIQEIDIYNINSSLITQQLNDLINEEGQKNLESRVTLSFTYDTRDSSFLTRKGTRIDLSAYVAGGPLGGDVQIYGFDFDAAQYFHLPYDTILLFNGEIASVANWNGGSIVPIFDRLYLGGASTLRGFKFRDVGPKDDEGNALGGNTMARLTVEYTIPIIERIRAAVFYDGGFVDPGSWNFGANRVPSTKGRFSGGFNQDIGVGVRLDLPIGPLRLDYGFPIEEDSFSSKSGQFQFSVGYQF